MALAAAALVAALAWPLLRPRPPAPGGGAADGELGALEEDLERALAAIREIEMDRRAGNLSEEDYRALDRAERARALELMRRRDALRGGG